jgi:arabinan endo-1,5-alpha-L-arabinosidase
MKTYLNPVYPGYFADPFVLRFNNQYWAYGTGPGVDGREFPILHSTDLVSWTPAGAAVEPLEPLRGGSFWAPEVAEKDGSFYLYYSAEAKGSDDSHRLRVAVAKHPTGPFIDAGKALFPDAGFTIDAHPFKDPKDGKWYLFFATDYTEQDPIGTGLAVVPMADDMISPLAPPTTVVRATCDWQIYERNRNYKGNTWPAWHCVEGPFVLFHEGKYYCLYSGGAWHTENYGLGFAVADHPLGPWSDDFAVHGPTVLKGKPDYVIGPGHNSVVLGPDGATDYFVYHAWDKDRTARRMCIDPLIWTKDGPRCDGPSHAPRTIVVRP